MNTLLTKFLFIAPVTISTLLLTSTAEAEFQYNTEEVIKVLTSNALQGMEVEGFGYGDKVTTELLHEGYSFTPYLYYNPDPWWFGAPTQVGNFYANGDIDDHLEDFSIHFPQAASDVAFLLWDGTNAVVEMTTYLNNEPVEAVSFVNPSQDPPPVIGFINTKIDRIDISVGTDRVIIDYLGVLPAEQNPACDQNADDLVDVNDLRAFWQDCRSINRASDGPWRPACIKAVTRHYFMCRAQMPPLHIGQSSELFKLD